MAPLRLPRIDHLLGVLNGLMGDWLPSVATVAAISLIPLELLQLVDVSHHLGGLVLEQLLGLDVGLAVVLHLPLDLFELFEKIL